MTTLVLLFAPRRRLRAGASTDGADGAGRARGEWSWATTADGSTVAAQGRCAAALLPKVATTVAVLADGDVAWHRITVPKAGAARMRAALAGALEEALLDDTDSVHLALAPQAAAGQSAWVAAVDRRWLLGELAALDAAGIAVDRVVPSAWPDAPPGGHFADTEGGATLLHWSHADGVASLPVQGALARTLLPQPPPEGTRWSASPAAAAAAEHWLGAAVAVLPPAERALQAVRSLWNLRQFELAARRRGTRRLQASARQFLGASWRPVRIGLVALVAVQVLGLNLWAWQQRAQLQQRRVAIAAAVQQAFPRLNPIDIQRGATAVMEREVQALRTQAGRAGGDDLEALLGAAASAWPAERGPVAGLRFEPGRLTLATPGWTPAQLDRLRSSLQPGGWLVETADGGLALRRAPGASL